MQGLELIGAVTVAYLRNAIRAREADEGTARFLLDRLTGEQVATICRTILGTADLPAEIEVKVPVSLKEQYELPNDVLTSEGIVHWRHAECSKAALLLASVNDNEEQSLGVLTRIGASELKAGGDLWIDVAARNLPLPEEQKVWWRQALKGLLSASDCSLDHFAAYVSATMRGIGEEGMSLCHALGYALPALNLPRDTGYFQAINQKKIGQAKSWEKMYRDAASKRACLLQKQSPSRRLIESEDLASHFEKVREQIGEEHHDTIRNFIASPPGWDETAATLATLEWEQDNINQIFTGLKSKETNLAAATKNFFEAEHPDELTPDEIAYLDNLKKRKTKEPIDDDREFYEKHRRALEENRSLRSKWDKFVYGQPIECTDFLIGLLTAIERLFDRADSPGGKKKLTIETQKKKQQSKWLELNADIGLWFCTRYHGLEQMTTGLVKWDTNWLFRYDELLKKAVERPKYKRNESGSRAATEIKFIIELTHGAGEKDSVQVIWRGNQNAIGMELRNDLDRLVRNPFLTGEVRRELVSRKGKLQGISLNDVTTLQSVFGRDCGSLIGTEKNSDDIARILSGALKTAEREGSLNSAQVQAISSAWNDFASAYREAVEKLTGPEGLASSSLLNQAEAYQRLLETLLQNARGDLNRARILAPVLRLGCITVTGGKPAAIIAPWHPLRLAAMAVKARQTIGLLNHILASERVDFGDSRLFFNDLRRELEHPYYPEVCVEYAGEEPKLLCVADSVNDYSLMERPIRDASNQAIDEEPTEAVEKLIGLTKRYLELLPHERTNLTVLLYNCDSTRLPRLLVNKLSEMDAGQEEVRCQVTLRHQDAGKLNRLYREMIEGYEVDPDAYIASEMSQDYLAKLRVNVMADEVPLNGAREGRAADIVFLQDVISRQAQEKWEYAPAGVNTPELLEHVPPRWSRKRAAQKDELKSTSWLICPRQPKVGECYVQAVACLVESKDALAGQFALPTRQIHFSNQETSKVIDEVHGLGEWVVNYDSLLERRQLMNKGIKVIRYRQEEASGKNLLVSSRASLGLLEVLIRRRLNDLNLDLAASEIDDLTRRFIDEANRVSGDIVLRAAKRGRFASELIGLVLSKILIAAELGTDSTVGWYFLDDYASWLGQKEEQIADILAICPTTFDNKPCLKIVVTESKYITESFLAESRKNSLNQLRDTVARIESAVFGNPGRLDRDLWLSRLSDIMLEGIEQRNDFPTQIEQWRDDLRAGRLPIDLSGYSHVFVSGPHENAGEDEQASIPKVDRCYQEIFSRYRVRELVLAFHHRKSVTKVREQPGADRPWLQSEAKPPAKKVSLLPVSNDGSEEIEMSAPVDSEPQEQFIPAEAQPTQPEETSASVEPGVQVTASDAGIDIASAGNGVRAWINRSANTSADDSAAEAWLQETMQKLRNALISYQMQAQVCGQRLTPNTALIRLRGTDRLTVDGIERKQNQILTTHGLKIINVSAQPGEILVSIARPQRQAISLHDVWAMRKINRTANINLSLVAGVRESDGEILYLNLGNEFEGLQKHAPHTLIAGTTGSGKSVLLRNLILDICAYNLPQDAKIFLIDPKAGVDYFALEELPHLAEGIITERTRATEILEQLTEEMERRYQLFRQARVSDLLAYNTQVGPQDRLPFLWAVHDEFAEWMLVEEYTKAVSATVQRLGVKARAAGIHLIFAAQRPDATVMPMQLRDNLGNRLILRVESIGTSEIALGQKGAELLLGKGHLLARLSGEPELIYAQVPFISDTDVTALVRVIKADFDHLSELVSFG
jgi:S-DNA-T family DNA segregation ATPase FtsK/SpoIIIE